MTFTWYKYKCKYCKHKLRSSLQFSGKLYCEQCGTYYDMDMYVNPENVIVRCW